MILANLQRHRRDKLPAVCGWGSGSGCCSSTWTPVSPSLPFLEPNTPPQWFGECKLQLASWLNAPTFCESAADFAAACRFHSESSIVHATLATICWYRPTSTAPLTLQLPAHLWSMPESISLRLPFVIVVVRFGWMIGCLSCRCGWVLRVSSPPARDCLVGGRIYTSNNRDILKSGSL